MENPVIFKIYDSLPRQGPGNDECTSYAFGMIPDLPKDALILDIGCGKGEQTLALARLCKEGKITALDIYCPYLDALEKKANEENLTGRIKTVCGSMDSLPFSEKSFDLIWAESSIFIIGFGNGLNYWKKFLKPKGYMVVTDLVWFTEKPSGEAARHWREEYPEMKTVDDNISIIESAGYSVLGMFSIPEPVWWESYYDHMARCLDDLKEEFRGDEEAEHIIRMSEKEMEIYSKYPGEYGMMFFIMKKLT